MQWSRVSSNVTRFDITDLPAFDLLNYLFGIAMETVDGYSSGVVWTKCLYNLSRGEKHLETLIRNVDGQLFEFDCAGAMQGAHHVLHLI